MNIGACTIYPYFVRNLIYIIRNMICIIGNELQSISLNNYNLGDFVDRIYPIELEIKNTTDTAWSAPCLDLHLEIERECLLGTKQQILFQVLHCAFPMYI
jgi:hypothetical protein